MAKGTSTQIDPDTGKWIHICRRCGPPHHPMKECPHYKHVVKGKPTEGVNTPTTMSDAPNASDASEAPKQSWGTLVSASTDSTEEHLHETRSNPSTRPEPVIDPIFVALSQAIQPLSSNSASPSDDIIPSASDADTFPDAVTFQLTDEENLSHDDGSPASSLTRSASPTPSGESLANPCFGFINGVYCGTRLIKIRRTRRHHKDVEKEVNIPKTFYDRIISLLTKLEDLSNDTECWLHFSAQHSTSQQPFIHYTSKCLQAEGGELMDGVHAAEHELYSSLMTARRHDVSQIAAELAKAKAAEQSVTEQALQARAAEHAACEELAALKAKLNQAV
uniref:Uncharacterized protein n=1 Tax=Moniliophthora roreri TaxID=221103 RepID=A0A0W0FFU1_MONRR